MDHEFSCLRFRSKALVLDQAPALVCFFISKCLQKGAKCPKPNPGCSAI